MTSPPESTPAPRLIERVPVGALPDAEAILDRFYGWLAATGLDPYPAQEEALLELMTGRHVVLSTPTGSGKSLVALGLHFKALCEGRRSFYTAPIKALVSEKFFALCETFGAENVGMLTGDASINWAAPIICCTAEVLANMALNQWNDVDAPYVVMDEFHYYADRDRGAAWQIPLLVLERTTFLLMSATLGNTDAIERRIRDRTGREVAHVHSDERPVPLDFEYRETSLLETVEQVMTDGRAPIYIVHFTQREAAEQAQGLTSAKVTDRDEKRAIAEAIGDFRFDSPYGKDVKRFISHGIGVHHAGLLPKYRLLVEQLAQQGHLKVICGTDTLGMGVNIPIRTVLFSKLCKFDGEKISILSVRDFKQIAGRAGRRGFDSQGSVVCQAPEHVVENKRLDAKTASAGGKKRVTKKKAPTRGFLAWNEETFSQLRERPSETLVSRFAVSHGTIMSCLQGTGAGPREHGYAAVGTLIERCHEEPPRKRRLRREAAVLFRALRHAGIVEVVRAPGGPARVVVREDLQQDFSLHHTLSLYLLEALRGLDRGSDTYALEVLSLVEAILENPRALLIQQERKAKDELVARLKAERVPYEERMERLEEVTYPKPEAEYIYSTFNLFCEEHPWVGEQNIRPKSIAREMFETYTSFEDFVRRLGLQRMEGVLLRYLNQVQGALVRTVPESARNDEVMDAISFLRTTLARVDSSLVQEWESLLHPGPRQTEVPDASAPRRLGDDPKVFRARVRAELHTLVRLLAFGRYEEAAEVLRQDPDDQWDAARLEEALAPFHAAHERIVFDPRARQGHLTVITQREPGWWDVHQVLVDDEEENDWMIEAEIVASEMEDECAEGVPLLRIRRIGQ